MATTVEEMRRALAAYPPDAYVHAYDGEGGGLVVKSRERYVYPHGGVGREELGFIPAPEGAPETPPRPLPR